MRGSTIRRRQRGVTLIELMIATSLVAIISAGMLIATRTTLLTYEKTEARLQANREAMGVVDILNRQLQSLMPALGECPNSVGTVNIVPLFIGTADSLRAVSQYSVAEGARGYPQILEYAVVPSPLGGLRLIVNEIAYTGPASAASVCRDRQFRPVAVTPDSLVLADGLASCRFLYHNPNPPNSLFPDTGWSSEWIIPAFPPVIRIEMSYAEPPLGTTRSGVLPLYSITAPIRTERAFQEEYAP